MKTQFEFQGVDKLKMKLNFNRMKPDLLKAMDESTDYAKKETQKQAPYRKGKLKKSVETKKAHVEGNRIVGEVSIGKFYAKFLEEGTKRHIIKPKTKYGKKAIKFDGVIVKYATHPGIRARKFFEKALQVSNEKISEIFSKYIDKFFSRA